jgi:Restriction endonuclease NotI
VAGNIYEWYGYRATDASAAAANAALQQHCPFLNGPCVKAGGVCSVTPSASGEQVVICPSRLYFDGHRFLRQIADDAFGVFPVSRGADGLPSLVAGVQARATAAVTGAHQVGVFGKAPWGGEIKLPSAVPGAGQYSVDFTVVVVAPNGDFVAFVTVEVQSIDTTNSYRNSLTALVQNNRQIEQSGFGMNWENVNKRILPQLIVKGLMLQAEALCTTGMYFVTPEPVFQRVMLRLGGPDRLRRIPKQPGSITFIRYLHDTANAVNGSPVDMNRLETVTVSTSDLSLAFITPENLPAAGAYQASITQKL